MNFQFISIVFLTIFNFGINPILLTEKIYKPKINKELSEFCYDIRIIWSLLIFAAWFFKLDLLAILILFYVDALINFLAAPYFFLYKK